MRAILVLLMLITGAVLAHAQPTWQPAVRFNKGLGQATYLPNLGEAGYVQFRYGPDGVLRYGIYDLKTLSDTSTVRCELPGEELTDKWIYSVMDADGNGKTDVNAGPNLFLDVCLPSQRIIPLLTYTGFQGGQADIDGNGRPEYLTHYTIRNLITLNESGAAFLKWEIVTRVPRAFVYHLGTLSGKPRFLTLSGRNVDGTFYASLAIEKLDPVQLQGDKVTATLTTVSMRDSYATDSPQRLFVFPDVWYLPRNDSMWVITADTIVTAPLDPSLGYPPDHFGQQQDNYGTSTYYLVVDGTRVELIVAGDRIRYVRLHADGPRLWVEDIAGIYPMLSGDTTALIPNYAAMVGDIDGDGLEDVILTQTGTETLLYLTTGRLLSSVREGTAAVPTAQRTQGGWVISSALCTAPEPRRAVIYDVRGALVAMSDVVPVAGESLLIRDVPLPQGLHFAVVGSCVVRLQ